MKKVLFILALVMVYGLSVSTVNAKVIEDEKTKVTVVADDNKTAKAEETPKATEAKAEGCGEAKAEAKAEGCSGTKTAAKAEGCSGTKTAAKAEGCGDKSKTTTASNDK